MSGALRQMESRAAGRNWSPPSCAGERQKSSSCPRMPSEVQAMTRKETGSDRSVPSSGREVMGWMSKETTSPIERATART